MIPATPVALGIVLLSQVPAPRTGSDVAAGLRVELLRIRQQERDQLAALADRLERSGEAELARRVRARIEPPTPPHGPERFVPLAEHVAGPVAETTAVPEADRIRAGSSQALFDLARKAAAVDVERFGIAAECLRAVLEREPNHREARRLLGFVSYRDGWATPEAAANLAAGQVLDATFGWVPADWVPHLARGELPAVPRVGQPTRWLPADRADAQRRDFFARPWEITTAHFQIKTNVPLAETIAFGRQLEALHDLFFTLFANVIDPKDLPLAQRFRNPAQQPVPSSRKHQVWYFSLKKDYRDYLLRRFGRDERISLGFYMLASEAERFQEPARCYFYRDREKPDDARSTLYHEASHQLLFESGTPYSGASNVGNYWIWEGLGTYFETIAAQPDGSFRVGDRQTAGLARGRAGVARNGPITPIAELVEMGEARFRAGPLVYARYAQAQALVVFFMHYDHGRYREAFLDYVADAYRGRFRSGGGAPPLIQRLGVSATVLDEQFQQFLDKT